jgi:hypothetical protein
MSWRRLQAEAPDLAEFGASRFAASRVAYLATVATDGRPRVHPVTPIVGGGHLFVFMEPTSPKGRDLDRGSAYALHAAVEDQEGGGGEFRVTGRGRRVTEAKLRQVAVDHAPYVPQDRYVLFELLVEDAFSTVYPDDGEPLRQRWRA